MSTGSDKLYRRYLSALGWVGDPGLHELVRSHLIKVPFENVSKLLRCAESDEPKPFTMEDFVAGIETRDLGGGCYAINRYFSQLLRFLEYDVSLLAAKIGNQERAHVVLLVNFEDGKYLVDVGFGAPFHDLINLSELPYKVNHGDFTYELRRHPLFKSQYEMIKTVSGRKSVTYAFNETLPLGPEAFDEAAAESLRPQGPLLDRLHIARFFDSRAYELHNNKLLTTSHNVTTTQALGSVREVEDFVRERMLLDRCPVGEAIDVLAKRGIDIFAS
ncbi:MAG: arylamine N-acetyltransferase [Nannocystaceae bacterium]